MHEGKDSYPVFHVHPQSTLAHTVAKIVATRSHRYGRRQYRAIVSFLANKFRMWVTDPQSPASSGPSTPSHSAIHIPLNSPSVIPLSPQSPPAAPSTSLLTPGTSSNNTWSLPPPTTPHLAQPYHSTLISPAGPPQSMSTSIPAASLPGARLSGHLVGVVSLTDILNLYARASGLSPADPSIYRSQRRRSSSSSLGIRKSGDIGRDIGRDVWNRGST